MAENATTAAPRSLMDWLPDLAYENIPELLDQPAAEPEADLRHSLRDIRLANLIGQGTAVVLHYLDRLTRDWTPGRTLTILDLATGSGDIPLAICRWADRRGFEVQILAVDISPEVIAAAVDHAGYQPQIEFAVMDARAMPFPDQSFDIVTCSLALHHLAREEGVAVIRTMARLARRGFIVNDIERCWPAYVAVHLLTITPITNRLTRHDGPASVKRAFTARELLAMAQAAGVRGAQVRRHVFWRQALVGRRKQRRGISNFVLIPDP
jgi:ubiquinone/menaquinone biosynthesis C-methylase UbiE